MARPSEARRGASSDAVARVNRTSIVELLRQRGAMTRQEIQSGTGLSPATVNRLTTALLREHVIMVAGNQPSSGGRPSVLLQFSGRTRVIAVVQVRSDGLHGALVDLDGRVVLRRSTDGKQHPRSPGADGQIAEIADVLDSLLATADGMSARAVGLSVAVPGRVAPDGGVSRVDHIGWESMPLGARLRERYDVPVAVENDGNALAVGELRGRDDAASFVALLLEEGIGAGIVTNGALYRGALSEAGEIGYLLVDREALAGSFHDRGDVESRLSAAALRRRLLAEGSTLLESAVTTPQAVLELARTGDAGARVVAEEVLDLLALAVAALVVVLDPQAVVLGSSQGIPNDLLPALHQRLTSRITRVPPLVAATGGADAVLIGAAELAAAEVNDFAYLDF